MRGRISGRAGTPFYLMWTQDLYSQRVTGGSLDAFEVLDTSDRARMMMHCWWEGVRT